MVSFDSYNYLEQLRKVQAQKAINILEEQQKIEEEKNTETNIEGIKALFKVPKPIKKNESIHQQV